jgi:hypothetical protein
VSGEKGSPFGFQFLFRAIAGVNQAARDNPVKMLRVEVEPFALIVRSERAPYFGTFVPVNGKPLQILKKVVFKGLGCALPVGILDAENEFAAVVSCEKPIK